MNTIYVVLIALIVIFLITDVLKKKFLNAGLWVVIGLLFYALINSIITPIEFKKTRDSRYAEVIENLKDIRESQLAHRTVTGKFNNSWDGLVNFIEKDSFTLTQRRDSSFTYIDPSDDIEKLKDTVVIDTLGFVSVRDSLFKEVKNKEGKILKTADRYKKMMLVPTLIDGTKFGINAGFIERNKDNKQAVFEVKIAKALLLHDQDMDMVAQENEVVSVEQVNGAYLKVGSMDKVDTNGNWPKVYGSND
jgi:energy-coupling factor transporter transmembrane protein EcfT